MDALNVLSLSDAKDFLRVDFDDDDNLITSIIYSAVALVEQKTQYRLYQRVEQEHSDGTYNVDLFQTPLNSVVIKNLDGVVQSQFQVKIEPVRQTVIFRKERIDVFGIPANFNNGFGPPFGNMLAASLPLFNIFVDCGYSNSTLIPTTLIQAVKTLVSYMYENRDMAIVDLPSNISIELAPFNRNPLF